MWPWLLPSLDPTGMSSPDTPDPLLPSLPYTLLSFSWSLCILNKPRSVLSPKVEVAIVSLGSRYLKISRPQTRGMEHIPGSTQLGCSSPASTVGCSIGIQKGKKNLLRSNTLCKQTFARQRQVFFPAELVRACDTLMRGGGGGEKGVGLREAYVLTGKLKHRTSLCQGLSLGSCVPRVTSADRCLPVSLCLSGSRAHGGPTVHTRLWFGALEKERTGFFRLRVFSSELQ